VRRRLLRASMLGGGSAALFVVAMGFLHTPYGRPLMRRLGMRCPARDISPTVAEALRLRGVRALRGARPALVRPALGLQLDQARLGDARGWAAARGGTCAARARPSALLTCRDVSGYDEITFGFAPDGRLVSASALREGMPAGQAARLFDRLRRDLGRQLGTEGEVAGDAVPAALAAGPLRVVRVQHRFSDYLATVTAMNLPQGVAVREQYVSARD